MRKLSEGKSREKPDWRFKRLGNGCTMSSDKNWIANDLPFFIPHWKLQRFNVIPIYCYVIVRFCVKWNFDSAKFANKVKAWTGINAKLETLSNVITIIAQKPACDSKCSKEFEKKFYLHLSAKTPNLSKALWKIPPPFELDQGKVEISLTLMKTDLYRVKCSH